jgi:hypothetical protein
MTHLATWAVARLLWAVIAQDPDDRRLGGAGQLLDPTPGDPGLGRGPDSGVPIARHDGPLGQRKHRVSDRLPAPPNLCARPHAARHRGPVAALSEPSTRRAGARTAASPCMASAMHVAGATTNARPPRGSAQVVAAGTPTRGGWDRPAGVKRLPLGPSAGRPPTAVRRKSRSELYAFRTTGRPAVTPTLTRNRSLFDSCDTSPRICSDLRIRTLACTPSDELGCAEGQKYSTPRPPQRVLTGVRLESNPDSTATCGIIGNRGDVPFYEGGKVSGCAGQGPAGISDHSAERVTSYARGQRPPEAAVFISRQCRCSPRRNPQVPCKGDRLVRG